MDRYRVEKRSAQKILLPDDEAEIGPVPTGGGGSRTEPEIDRLSNIIKEFNDLFGTTWEDADRVTELITQAIPERVAEDAAFQNALRNSGEQNARVQHVNVLQRVMTSLMKDDMKLFKQFMDDKSFKRWMVDTIYALASERATAQPVPSGPPG